MTPLIIRAVIDLQSGQVVRGIAGRRSEYRPIVSQLCDSADPLAVARAFADKLGLRHLYLADLDAIARAKPAFNLYRELLREGFDLWVDAGLVCAADARPLFDLGIQGVVFGLETLRDWGQLSQACLDFGSAVVFSLDLRDGVPLQHTQSAVQTADTAVACGVGSMLLLDLARVGVGAGTGTEDLLGNLHAHYPQLHLAAGGGLRDRDDLHRLQIKGASTILVASALHDSRLTRDDLL